MDKAEDLSRRRRPRLKRELTSDESVTKMHSHRRVGVRKQPPGSTSTTKRDETDWRWQLRNAIRTKEQLKKLIELRPDEELALSVGAKSLPFMITPYYFGLINRDDPDDPIRKTVIPRGDELIRQRGEDDDPLHEDDMSPVPGLVHRYPDRVLFLSHDKCATYCRYCTRSRVVGRGKISPSCDRISAAAEYVRSHPEIRDVIVSGGDPLLLPGEVLDRILSAFRAIDHVEIVRIGTKVPVVLPQGVTPNLVRVLKKYAPLYASIHFTHPNELTKECKTACDLLVESGIVLGSQTVLLAGVNDTVETMTRLMRGLLRFRVRPYYMYQCDPISGSSHFRTPVQKGLDIIEGLRGHTSGYAVPAYIIDAPGGGGKIQLLPETVVGRDENGLLLKNFRGDKFVYPEI